MSTPTEILKKYWGYEQFRPLQEDIILAVLSGHDTLALLPTGGGKSICFQVPALVTGKPCLVVSPLIALMKDQVSHLKEKGITAEALSSDMNPFEMSHTIERLVEGQIQFIYVSPERLNTEAFSQLLPTLNIGLIAVDEAHCISQWGYDFRPAYLQIAEIRTALPGVPVIALTATATPLVCDDIEEKLHFSNNKRFKKSFARPNLAYIVRNTENKYEQLYRILDRIHGSSVVYINNRKKTREIALDLTQKGYSASYYHAGLDPYTRNERQQAWIRGDIRVIVCTNAFGMGIDKPDVRTVIHMGIPESPEAYFQEAGRAGRDGKNSWAVLLNDSADISDQEHRFNEQYPEFETVKAVYNWLGNYFQIVVGFGEQLSFPFDINQFCKQYKLSPIQALQSIKFIEREGLIALIEPQQIVSKLMIRVNQDVLYDFEFRNPSLEPVIKTLLRSYGGIFTEFVAISENDLSKRLGVSFQKTIELLRYLDKVEIVSYSPATGLPNILFLMSRQHPDRLPLSKKNYEDRKKAALDRLHAIFNYIKNNGICRSTQLVSYFGELHAPSCGSCDVCIEQGNSGIRDIRRDKKVMQILLLIDSGIIQPELLIEKISGNPDETSEAIRFMLDENFIIQKPDGSIERKNT